MKLVSAKNTIALFYYLMSVDSNVTEVELQKLDDIGAQTDADRYSDYRDEIIEQCEIQKQSVIDEI